MILHHDDYVQFFIYIYAYEHNGSFFFLRYVSNSNRDLNTYSFKYLGIELYENLNNFKFVSRFLSNLKS